MISRLPTRKARRGFTLTEMLVVVAIIVVLAAIAIPITMNVLAQAKVDIAKSQMKGPIRAAIFDYCRRYGKEGDFPTTSLQLLGPPDGKGILTRDVAMDPWGRAYTIQMEVEDPDQPQFIVVSGGPNGSEPIQVTSIE